MPALTRRRSPDAREECWHVYYGDVHAGTIAIRTGIPSDEGRWEWHCGFYPGSHPGEHQSGTAETFDQARADFEQAWAVFLSNRTEADFQSPPRLMKKSEIRARLDEPGQRSKGRKSPLKA